MINETKATPGPWHVCMGGPIEIRGEGDARFGPLAQVTDLADARLIAAAPELLEALREIRDRTFVDAEGPELRAQNECNHRTACAAIAKAEGAA